MTVRQKCALHPKADLNAGLMGFFWLHSYNGIMRVTRLAPSPTGALHLGNARTFLVNWLVSRQNGWKVVLRIEDLDGPRIKRQADQALIKDLQWIGLDWDDGPVYQSARGRLYSGAIEE